MKEQEAEVLLLLNVVVKVSVKLMEASGDSFFPFAARLLIADEKRRVVLHEPKGMKEGVTAEELEAYWKRELAKPALEGGCSVACTVADVRVPDSSGNLTPSIFIHAEHIGGLTANLLRKYERVESNIALEPEYIWDDSERWIFPQR